MKFFICILAFWGALLSQTPYVEAHVLEKQGSIGAVLHINPADDPIAGEESGFYFDFQDTSNQFNTNKCTCRLVIEQNGGEIYNELFSAPNGGNYTFPARGVYVVKAVGQPQANSTFQPFTLSYNVRVERGNAIGAPSSRSQNIPFLITGTITLLFAFYVIRAKIVHNVK